MRISLGLRVLTLIGTINVAVFGAGLVYLTEKISGDQLAAQRLYASRLLETLAGSFNDRGELRVEEILRWPSWNAVEDAIIVDKNAGGVSLNPVGASSRDAHFDRGAIEQVIERAIATEETVEAPEGLALPIIDGRGAVWGGCWFRVEPPSSEIWRELLPWFAVTTLLLFLGTFSVLRRYVLQPVGQLAAGARRVAGADGELALPVPAYSDELSDLIQAFNRMSADVRRFHGHLEEEVEAATRKAYEVEAAALRQRRLAAMGELAAGIAHEINNPLGGMLNAVEVLDRPDTSPERRASYHRLLHGGLERIQDTVAKLLRFTPRDAALVPLDLAAPVEDAVALVRHRAAEQGVELAVDLSRGPCPVRGQASELGQAVLNLLVNALDALEESGGGGRVEVELFSRGDEVILSVRDDGPGVPPDVLERVGDLFYTTKEVGRGTGLGLALVHTVIDAHRGQVHLRNRSEGGLAVELRLPAAEAGGEG